MTVMTLDKKAAHVHDFVIGSTQLYVVALLVVLALAMTLTLVFALPTVESFHFGNFRVLPNDFAHFATLAL